MAGDAISATLRGVLQSEGVSKPRWAIAAADEQCASIDYQDVTGNTREKNLEISGPELDIHVIPAYSMDNTAHRLFVIILARRADFLAHCATSFLEDS
jgi:hypothetical protein